MRRPLLLTTRARPWRGRSCKRRCTIGSKRSLSIGTNTETEEPKTPWLPTAPARTRFAPSPTGYLHLGSLRTALYSYLLAKATGGQFVLRIEDTDTKRTVPDAEKRICEDLRWAGLPWDEGPEVGGPYGPYRQSERSSLYREHATKLVESGHAYRCFCSTERLENLHKAGIELRQPTNYDRKCASLSSSESGERASKAESHVVRLKAPVKYPAYHDLVYGKITARGVITQHGVASYDDTILLKSDGLPTYHLANVVDDHHMQISHVIRATEWVSSTAKHAHLHQAFEWQPPAYAHVGLLQDAKGSKLSKRNLDLDISHFRHKWEVAPETLANFVALLGWSHGRKSDVMSMEELIDSFDTKFTRGNVIVTFQKLRFLQKAHTKALIHRGGQPLEDLIDRIAAHIEAEVPADESALVLPRNSTVRSQTASIVQHDGRNITTAPAFFERNDHFFRPLSRLRPGPPTLTTINDVEADANKSLLETLSSAVSQSFITSAPERWTIESIKSQIDEMVDWIDAHPPAERARFDSSGGAVTQNRVFWNKVSHQYLRWALAGGKAGPPVAAMMAILGRDVCVQRLEAAEQHGIRHEWQTA